MLRSTYAMIIGIFLSFMIFAQGENWVYRYNGPGNSWDYAEEIIYGDDGNIYAAGYSRGVSSNDDFIVISLSPTGDTNWVYRYDGSASEGDHAFSICYGTDGNIYAAGFCTEVTSSRDILVISLTTAGDTNWVYRYNGPAGSGWDEARSIVYGDDDRLYVAGYSTTDTLTGPDFVVICIIPGSGAFWIFRYSVAGYDFDIANSVIYGNDGNIYAAGFTHGIGTDQDVTVVSLKPWGETNWIYRYDGPAHLSDVARSITYNGDATIHVGGYSTGIGTSSDVVVISLDTTGSEDWIYRYNGSGNGQDAISSIISGNDGNIYAAGYSYEIGTSYDAVVISLSSTGDTNWVYRYNGPINSNEYFTSLVAGADSTIYIAGSCCYGSTDEDFIVMSIEASGDSNWIYRYNGDADSIDIAYTITYGADDNIYTAGFSCGTGTSADFTVISLPPDLAVKENQTIVSTNRKSATIFSGPLVLPEDRECKVFDITGREIKPHLLAPGIYFIEIDGKITQKAIKVR